MYAAMFNWLGYVKYRGVTDVVTVDNTAGGNRSAQLGLGWHLLISDVDCYFRQGDENVQATVGVATQVGTTGHYLPAGQQRLINVQEAGVDDYVAVIRKDDDGLLEVL